jgi:DNA-binding NarL/FixJ family response regulator
MIDDTKIDFRLTNISELKILQGCLDAEHGHYKKLISTISALNNRSEKFCVVIQITDSSITPDDNHAANQLRLFIGSLSKREMQVYGLAIRGLSNKAIAEKLFVTVETIKSHRKGIVRKANVKKIDDIKSWILEANKLID